MAAETAGCSLVDLMPDIDRVYLLHAMSVYGQFKAWAQKKAQKKRG